MTSYYDTTDMLPEAEFTVLHFHGLTRLAAWVFMIFIH